MEQTSSQAPHPGMAPDDAAASLAMATHISTQLATPQQPQEAQNAPTGAPEDVTQIDLAPQVEQLQKQVDALTKKVAQEPKDDLSEIRKMVEDALAEDDPNDHGQ